MTVQNISVNFGVFSRPRDFKATLTTNVVLKQKSLNFTAIIPNNTVLTVVLKQKSLNFTATATGITPSNTVLTVTLKQKSLNFTAIATDNTTQTVIVDSVVYGLTSKAITEFTQFNFLGSVLFNGKTLLFNNQGLYEYGADTDDSLPIPFLIKTSAFNLDSQHRKKLFTSKCYVTAKKTGTLQLKVTVDNNSQTYENSTVKNEWANFDFKIGRGFDGVFWQFALSSDDIKQTFIDSLEVELTEIQRRVN